MQIEINLVSLSAGRDQAWFDRQTKKAQKEYLAKYPNSKFGSGAKSTAPKKKSSAKTPARPTKRPTARAGAKEVVDSLHHNDKNVVQKEIVKLRSVQSTLAIVEKELDKANVSHDKIVAEISNSNVPKRSAKGRALETKRYESSLNLVKLKNRLKSAKARAQHYANDNEHSRLAAQVLKEKRK